MAANPKLEIKSVASTITTTIDDNATAALIVVIYEGGPETLKYLFYVVGADVVVSVDDPSERASGDRREVQDQAAHYTGIYPVKVIAVDKTGVTATKMQFKMRLQMSAVFRPVARTRAGFTMKIQSTNEENRRKGGLDKVWQTTYDIEYMWMNP